MCDKVVVPDADCMDADSRRQLSDRLQKLHLDPSEITEFSGGFGDLKFIGEYALDTRRIGRRSNRKRK